MYYFPLKYKDKHGGPYESNPDIRAAQENDKKRASKFEWFWNGRLIPKADSELWFLTAPPSGREGIPTVRALSEKFIDDVMQECYEKRIKVACFVDSTVGVSKSKVYLDVDNSSLLSMLVNRPSIREGVRMPLFESLLKSSEGGLATSFFLSRPLGFFVMCHPSVS